HCARRRDQIVEANFRSVGGKNRLDASSRFAIRHTLDHCFKSRAICFSSPATTSTESPEEPGWVYLCGTSDFRSTSGSAPGGISSWATTVRRCLPGIAPLPYSLVVNSKAPSL